MNWGGYGLAYGVGLYACTCACTRVRVRNDIYPNANRHVRGVHTGVWGHWVIVMIISL